MVFRISKPEFSTGHHTPSLKRKDRHTTEVALNVMERLGGFGSNPNQCNPVVENAKNGVVRPLLEITKHGYGDEASDTTSCATPTLPLT